MKKIKEYFNYIYYDQYRDSIYCTYTPPRGEWHKVWANTAFIGVIDEEEISHDDFWDEDEE